MKTHRLKLKHLGGKITYSAVAFNNEESANKYAKRNKKAFDGCEVSIVSTRKTSYFGIKCI